VILPLVSKVDYGIESNPQAISVPTLYCNVLPLPKRSKPEDEPDTLVRQVSDSPTDKPG
jgi:hypothetical protein